MLDGPAAVERWTVTVKDPVLALSVRAGSLITSSGTGRQALDGTGKPRWTLPVASYVGTPGISASADERVLYLVGNSGPSLVSSVVAADSGTGAKLWSLPVPQPGWMASTVAGVVGDTVIVTGLSTTTPGQGFVWAVDARSRQTVWQLSGADAATVFVSPSGTKAVVGSKAGATDGQLQLIDVANGGARGWRKTMPRGFGLAVSVYGPGVVCWAGDTLVCATGELTALNGETGEQVWSFKTGNPMLQNCAASADGRWVFASGYQTLYCLDGRTGALAWKIPLRSGLFPPNAPILSDSGNVYTIDAGGTLWAVDAATGTTRWKYHNPAASSSVATYWTAAGGRAYVAVGKTVTALDASGL
jgi:outer membrane protein assembly factor BamB